MNGSQIAKLAPAAIAKAVPAAPEVRDRGMSFGSAPHQDKQRATAKFRSVTGHDGHATDTIVSIHTHPQPVEFRMLPGGRWVEMTVWQRIMSGKRLPCDP